MELSQEGSGISEVVDENCKMSTMSMSAEAEDDGEEDEDEEGEGEEEAEEENVLCYTFSADLLASGDIVDVTSNCVDMQGLSEAAVELMRPATIVRTKQPINSTSLNLPSVVIHSASNTTPKKKKRNTSSSVSSSSSSNNNNNDSNGGGIPKRSKSFHISSQKKRKISF